MYVKSTEIHFRTFSVHIFCDSRYHLIYLCNRKLNDNETDKIINPFNNIIIDVVSIFSIYKCRK